jgi:hypothetical protein
MFKLINVISQFNGDYVVAGPISVKTLITPHHGPRAIAAEFGPNRQETKYKVLPLVEKQTTACSRSLHL